jgi:hypothetical protein
MRHGTQPPDGDEVSHHAQLVPRYWPDIEADALTWSSTLEKTLLQFEIVL